MKSLKNIILISGILLLGACEPMDDFKSDLDDLSAGKVTYSNMSQDPSERLLESPCPQVEIVDDLSSISDFTNPQKQNKANLVSRVDLRSAESTCKLASKSAVVDLKLIFDGKLGTKGRANKSDKPFFSYPFFVAVTSPSGKIMAKEIFAASLTYPPNETSHTYYEKLRQIIPIKGKDQARYYKILIGFQVTPDQLNYNRTHMVPVANSKAVK
ncbi:MAG: hypothetical protein ACRBDI_09055 [Alphaproteobacteria bacterium]